MNETAKKVLEDFGVNFGEVLARYDNSEGIYSIFLKKLFCESDYEDFITHFELESIESAYLCAYSLLTEAQSLGLSSLSDPLSSICAELEDRNIEGAKAFLGELDSQYNKIKEFADII